MPLPILAVSILENLPTGDERPLLFPTFVLIVPALLVLITGLKAGSWKPFPLLAALCFLLYYPAAYVVRTWLFWVDPRLDEMEFAVRKPENALFVNPFAYGLPYDLSVAGICFALGLFFTALAILSALLRYRADRREAAATAPPRKDPTAGAPRRSASAAPREKNPFDFS